MCNIFSPYEVDYTRFDCVLYNRGRIVEVDTMIYTIPIWIMNDSRCSNRMGALEEWENEDGKTVRNLLLRVFKISIFSRRRNNEVMISDSLFFLYSHKDILE